MPLLTAFLLGALQGFAELFPFSSLGLLVILPHVAHFIVPAQGARYLPFLVALHFGTALALLWYFRQQWMRIIRGFVHWFRGNKSSDGRMAWLLIWGTIPAGLAGLLLKHKIAGLFGRPLIAALFLVVNGLFLLWGSRRSRYQNHQALSQMTGREALKVGLYQMFALIPGLSRSGLTIVAGLREGLSPEEAAHFSFLLATPIILAAALLELPKLHHHGVHGLLVPAMLGGVVAYAVAWLSTRFLLRYFRTHRLATLGWISIALGAIAILAVH